MSTQEFNAFFGELRASLAQGKLDLHTFYAYEGWSEQEASLLHQYVFDHASGLRTIRGLEPMLQALFISEDEREEEHEELLEDFPGDAEAFLATLLPLLSPSIKGARILHGEEVIGCRIKIDGSLLENERVESTNEYEEVEQGWIDHSSRWDREIADAFYHGKDYLFVREEGQVYCKREKLLDLTRLLRSEDTSVEELELVIEALERSNAMPPNWVMPGAIKHGVFPDEDHAVYVGRLAGHFFVIS